METHEFRRLYRSRSNRMLWGVCGGIGEYFHVDPTLIRIAWLATAFLGGAGIVCYLLAVAIIPAAGGETAGPAAGSRSTAGRVIGGLCILFGVWVLMQALSHLPLASVIGLPRFWWVPGSIFLALVLVGVGLVMFLGVRRMLPAGIEGRPLYRPHGHRMLWGVCAAFGLFFRVDPTLVRISWVMGTLLTGFFIGVAMYVACCVLIPEESTVSSNSAAAGAI